MKISVLRGCTNAILLFAIIVTNTLYASRWGLEGSIWPTISVMLVGLFFIFNFSHVNPTLFCFFAVPVQFVAGSVLVNGQTLHPGGFRSAVATGAAYLLFTLSGVPLSQRLFRRLVVLYLIIGLPVSAYFLSENWLEIILLGNSNFSVNPNSAAIYFFFCTVLCLLYMPPKFKWLFVIAYSVLMVTTQARGGTVALIVAIAGYWVLGDTVRRTNALRRLAGIWKPVALLLAIVTIVLASIPGSFDLLVARFSVTASHFGTSRGEIWNEAIAASHSSTATILFGHGPATLENILGTGSHSSYLEALGSLGYPFLITTLIALAFWVYVLARAGHRHILWISAAILLYGTTETILFRGVGTLWLGLAIIGLYLQSRNVDAARVRHRSGDMRFVARSLG
jgi:hypothetical protein